MLCNSNAHLGIQKPTTEALLIVFNHINPLMRHAKHSALSVGLVLQVFVLPECITSQMCNIKGIKCVIAVLQSKR